MYFNRTKAIITFINFIRARRVSKSDYNYQWDEWHAPRFQRTSSNHSAALPRYNSRINEFEQ